MAWTATLMETWPGTAPCWPKVLPVAIARSERKPTPPELLSATGEPLPASDPLVQRLARIWTESRGLHGTGYVGEVRDMLHSLRILTDEIDYLSLEVPEATRQKAREEAEAAFLPEGAVW